MVKKQIISRKEPDYGFDAPPWLMGLLFSGTLTIFISVLLHHFLGKSIWGLLLAGGLGIAGLVLFFLGILMLIYGLLGKHRTREYMLDRISWKGDETILDIGTGLGLLAVGAAKRAPHGKIVGIDLWIAKDLSGNSKERALENAVLEGVENRVDFQNVDASKLPYPDGTFDVVLSLLCLHNIEDAQARANSCREIARVLKPGGVALIGDYIPCTEYELEFRKSGLKIRQNKAKFHVALSLMWLVEVEKTEEKSP